MIEVRVKIFGPLRDIVPQDEVVLKVPPPYNGEAAFDALASHHPRVRAWKASVRLAVNLEYADMQHRLRDGDEVVFIPPVSGG